MTNQTKLPEEFTHIEINVVRNPNWLKHFEKQGFFLSEHFPVCDVLLPKEFEFMEEKDLRKLQSFFRALLRKAELQIIEYSE